MKILALAGGKEGHMYLEKIPKAKFHEKVQYQDLVTRKEKDFNFRTKRDFKNSKATKAMGSDRRLDQTMQLADLVKST